MSLPGWYPDPGGRAGHYRLWDGERWGLSSTTDPPGAPAPAPPPRRGRPGRWIAAGIAVLVALGVVVALVLAPGGPPGAATSPAPASAPVSSAGPTSAAPLPLPPPSATPSPTLAPQPSEVASAGCPVGDPFSRQDHPRDGRVHGGGLSFPRQPGWTDPGAQASTFTWAYDLGETDVQLQQTRYAAYAVGAVSVADGFEDPRTAARLAMRCTAASALYSNVSGRTDLVDRGTTVDGYRAWTVRSEIRAYDPRTGYAGDTVQITVVDLGSPEALGFFWGSAPIGDETFTDRLDEAARAVRVG